MIDKDNDNPIKRLIKDRKRLRKMGDMSMPGDTEPFDPASDFLEFDHEGTPVSHKQEYDPEVSTLNAEYRKALKQAEGQLWDKFVKDHPQAASLRRHATRAYLSKSKPPGYSKVPLAILSRMMVPGWVNRTQAAVLAKVQEELPQYSMSKNIWTQEQKGWQLDKLRATVSMAGPRFSQADVSRCKTLSDFKRALTAHIVGKDSGDTCRATISVTQDTVTINALPIKVTVNRAGGKEYRRIQVRVDTLLEALRRRTRRSTEK